MRVCTASQRRTLMTAHSDRSAIMIDYICTPGICRANSRADRFQVPLRQILDRGLAQYKYRVCSQSVCKRLARQLCPLSPPSILDRFGPSVGPSSVESLRSPPSVLIPYPATMPSNTVLPTTCRSSSSGSRPSASARCMTSCTDSIRDEVRCSEARFCACCEGCCGGACADESAPGAAFRP